MGVSQALLRLSDVPVLRASGGPAPGHVEGAGYPGAEESGESHVRPESSVPRTGPAEGGHGEASLLCHCRIRTADEIRAEILRLRLKTVEEVYARVLGGGGCRTCAPEIRKLLSESVSAR